MCLREPLKTLAQASARRSGVEATRFEVDREQSKVLCPDGNPFIDTLTQSARGIEGGVIGMACYGISLRATNPVRWEWPRVETKYR